MTLYMTDTSMTAQTQLPQHYIDPIASQLRQSTNGPASFCRGRRFLEVSEHKTTTERRKRGTKARLTSIATREKARRGVKACPIKRYSALDVHGRRGLGRFWSAEGAERGQLPSGVVEEQRRVRPLGTQHRETTGPDAVYMYHQESRKDAQLPTKDSQN